MLLQTPLSELLSLCSRTCSLSPCLKGTVWSEEIGCKDECCCLPRKAVGSLSNSRSQGMEGRPFKVKSGFQHCWLSPFYRFSFTVCFHSDFIPAFCLLACRAPASQKRSAVKMSVPVLQGELWPAFPAAGAKECKESRQKNTLGSSQR